MSWTTTMNNGWTTTTANNGTYVIITGSFSGMQLNFSGMVSNWSGVAVSCTGTVVNFDDAISINPKEPKIDKAPELDVAFAKRSVARVFRKMGLPG